LNEAVIKCKNTVESIDPERIILDDEGKYPRRMIITCKGGFKKEYRLVKTQAGNFILNR
jgi:hypothetical protein